MFKKWFSRLKSPSKSGSHGGKTLDDGKFAKIFDLELSNMEGVPSYTLTHQLTIGSEIGNIVIADPSVSPRHATFILQQEVISVIDHSSVAGTFVNGKKIASGKYIILEESDVIAVGDLEVRIKVRHEAFPEETEGPPSEENLPKEYEPAKLAGDIELDNISKPKITAQTPKEKPVEEKKVMTFKVQSTAGVVAEKAPKSKPKKRFKFSFTKYHSANTLVRIMAILGDLLLAFIIVEVMIPFDDFKALIDFIPSVAFDLIGFQPNEILDIIFTDVPQAKTVWDETVILIPKALNLGPILVCFIIVRLFTTLLMGVSISEFMVGIRAVGNGIWNRIGGTIRVLLGLITGPFLIFDLPALFSRRTFKEFMTFTNTDADSKGLTILGSIVYFPLLLALLLVSPLIQGFEPLEPIDISARIDKRVKVVVKEGEAPQAEPVLVKDGSKVMGFSASYPASDVTIIPAFKFQAKDSKLAFQVSPTFYLKEYQRPVVMEVYKNFDFKELLDLALRGNFMLFNKYPELYAFTHETMDKSFKTSMTPESQEIFAKEFMNYTRLAFGLSLDNVMDVAQTETFVFRNLIDYKSSLLGLLEYKDFTQADLAQVGDAYFFRAIYNTGNKPFDLIIPLTKAPGRIFKITFDKREKVKEVSSKFYKFIMERSAWLSPDYQLETEKFTALETVDFFSQLKKKDRVSMRSKAKAVYGFYYELIADVLRRNDQTEYGILKKSVDDVEKIVSMLLQTSPEGEAAEDASIVKKFQDLKAANDGKNRGFFGLEQTI